MYMQIPCSLVALIVDWNDMYRSAACQFGLTDMAGICIQCRLFNNFSGGQAFVTAVAFNLQTYTASE